MTIPPEHIKIEVIDPYPKGGQRVGAMLTAVRITHLPTGISAQSGYARSQVKNKAICEAMLEEALSNPELGMYGEVNPPTKSR